MTRAQGALSGNRVVGEVVSIPAISRTFFFHHIGHFPLAPGAEGDHFPGIGKMVENCMPRHLAGGFCFGNNGLEVIPFPIAQQVLKVARKPELNAAFRLPGVGFKVVGAGLGDFGFHAFGLFIRRWTQMASLPEAVRFLNEKPLDGSFS